MCALRLGNNRTVHQREFSAACLVGHFLPLVFSHASRSGFAGSSSGSRALPLLGRLPNRIRPVTMSRSRPSAVHGGSGAGARALSALRAAAAGGGGGAGSGCCCSLSDGSFGKLSTVSSRAAEAAPAAASLSSAAVKRKAARQWRRLVPSLLRAKRTISHTTDSTRRALALQYISRHERRRQDALASPLEREGGSPGGTPSLRATPGPPRTPARLGASGQGHGLRT